MAVLSSDRCAATRNSSCAKSASKMCPPSHRDTNTFFTGNVPPRGIFCMFGLRPLNLPVADMCCVSPTWSKPSGLVKILIPSTNVDRYDVSADNLLTSCINNTASFILLLRAVLISMSRLSLPVLKPLAFTHDLSLGDNLNPATTPVFNSKYPFALQSGQPLGFLKLLPSFFILNTLPFPLHLKHILALVLLSIVL